MYMYLYLCICVYMYVYVCICMHMYVYVCVCMYMCVYLCICMYMYVYVCTSVWMDGWIDGCVHAVGATAPPCQGIHLSHARKSSSYSAELYFYSAHNVPSGILQSNSAHHNRRTSSTSCSSLQCRRRIGAWVRSESSLYTSRKNHDLIPQLPIIDMTHGSHTL